jgi:hypothetical protein
MAQAPKDPHPAGDPAGIQAFAEACAHRCFPRQPLDCVSDLFLKVTDLFQGRIPPYQESDTAYHDLDHTLRVVACWCRMFEALHTHHPEKPLSYPDFLLGLAGSLLHDTGYLKEQHDPSGTGAKFALIHEARSCQIARRFLLGLKWPDAAIAVAQRLIASTGPRAIIDGIRYASPTEKTLAQMLATADFLAQMADPLYLEKLPDLFKEFEELDRLRGLSQTERPFPNLDTLVSATPVFWYQFVLPRLKLDYASVYRLLNDPYPEGPNPYLARAEANIKELQDSQTESNS